MAEILLCNGRSPAPAGKETGWWKDGDPVVVMPDGHSWGAEELNEGKFKILKAPGVSVEEVEAYIVSWPGNSRRRFRINHFLKQIVDKNDESVVHQF